MPEQTARRESVMLEIPPGAAFENNSGFNMLWPKVNGAFSEPPGAKHAALVIHPSSNFMNHYLMQPLYDRGIALLGLNCRYVNGDSTAIMERAIQDVGAGVKFLRARGYDFITLLGNSGGASLVSFFQAQAENLTITHTPAGDPVDLRPEHLPPADAIALVAGHHGRGMLMLNCLDGSMIDERDPLSSDPSLDIYNLENGPPFAPDFVKKYRAAQRQRSEAITHYAQQRLRYLRKTLSPTADEAFIVYRTYADVRFVDNSIDKNDRPPGGNRGRTPQEANLSPNNLGRYTTLTSWLSQWSLLTNCDGPASLEKTAVPVLQVEYTADGGVFPTDVKAYSAAAKGRIQDIRLEKATHYMKDDSATLNSLADSVADWIKKQ